MTIMDFSNENNDATRHNTNDSLTTSHIAERLERAQTTAHVEQKLGTQTHTPAQNQGKTAPHNNNCTFDFDQTSSDQGSNKPTE